MENGVMMQYFEWYLPADGGHWRRLAAAAQDIRALGFSALWLPPACKCMGGINDTGYGIYDPYDLGEFDQRGSVPTKYGTKDEYIAAIAACHAAGLEVYADVVLDHLMGSDGTETVKAKIVAGDDRLRPVSDEHEIRAWTRFTYPARRGRYSRFKWSAKDFDGIDYDDETGQKGIFLLDGKDWDSDVDHENDNYDYLMGADLDFSNPEVVQQLTNWGKWYLRMCGMDGFRLDAVKHIRSDFYRDWLPAMRKYAKRDLFAVGEYWNPQLGPLLDYLTRVNGTMSLFDVPLHYNFNRASHDAANFDLRKIFDGTLTQSDPTQSVPFVDNHDTQPGQALASWVDGWFKLHAYALILLRNEGYPCVFYGDLYGIPHDNIAPVGVELKKMLQLRTHTGPQHDYFDDPRSIGWTRGDMAVVLSSGDKSVRHMNLGAERAGQIYSDALDNCPERVTIGPDGWADFPVAAGSVSVYIPEPNNT